MTATRERAQSTRWEIGIICGIFDIWGHSLAVWVPSYQGIGSGFGPGVRVPTINDPALDLIINGGFERGLDRWIRTNTLVTTTLETANANVYQGVNSLKIDSAGAGSVAASVVQTSFSQPGSGLSFGGRAQQLVRVIPGSTLTAYATARWNANAGATGQVEVWWFDANGNLISSSNAIVTWSTETTFTTKSGSIAVPANAFYAALAIGFLSAVGATSFWIDEVHASAPGASLSGAVGSGSLPATL